MNDRYYINTCSAILKIAIKPHQPCTDIPRDLSSSFELVRTQVVAALEGLLLTKEIQVENAELVWRAVRLYRASAADFSDCLIAQSAAAAGCERTMSFDRGAVKNCSMTLIQ